MSAHASMRWSPWALLALALSMGLCPFVTVLGIPMGLLGLADVRKNGRRGRRVAKAALWVSIIVTPLTTTFAIWWNVTVRDLLKHGPVAALRAGQQGDAAAFAEGLGGLRRGGDLTSAKVFLQAVTQRWGLVQSMRPSDEAPDLEAPDRAWWVGYEVLFEQGAAHGRALFVLRSPQGGFVLNFQKLEFDIEGGVLRWPPAQELVP